MRKNPLKRKKKDKSGQPARITNETVAEHREKVLAGGRKFKYPHQYVRHKLVINAILLALLVLIVASVVGWWQLYKAQNTGQFMYRVTRVLPVPVASVNGASVRYSDYLMRYRSHEHHLRSTGQIGLNAEDDKKQLDFYKRDVLTRLEKDIYGEKLAREKGITTTSAEVDATIDAGRNTITGRISQEAYDASIQDVYGYSPSEYRHIITQVLLREKVVYSVDDSATAVKNEVAGKVKNLKRSDSLEKLADTLKKQGKDVEYGASGQVSRNNHDDGLTTAALKLKVGEISGEVQSKSTVEDKYYYYFLRRLEADDKKASYEYVRIPLTTFDTMFDELKKGNGVQEFIGL